MEIKEYKNISEKLYKKVLPNGLTVLFVQKNEYKRSFACLGTKYGALTNKFIPYGENEYIDVPLGIAHFLEHKLFEMKDGTDATNRFATLGLEANAFTDYNQTVYLFSGTDNINEGINFLLDFVQEPYFTDENVAKEQGIIDQELKMYMDMPGDRLHLGILSNLFKEYPVRYDIGGTVESIKNINKEFLYKCYNTFYHPSNMIFALVGDFDSEQFFSLIEENQNKKEFPKPLDIRKIFPLEDNQAYLKTSSIEMDITIPKVVVGLKLPYQNYKEEQPIIMELLFKIMLEANFGSSSETYQEMLDLELVSEGLSYSVYIDEFCGYIKIGASSKKPEEFKEYIRKKLLTMSKVKMKKSSFDKYKKAILGSFIRSLNSSDFIATSLLEYKFKNCDILGAINLLEELELKDMKEMGKYFVEKAIADFTIYPKTDRIPQ